MLTELIKNANHHLLVRGIRSGRRNSAVVIKTFYGCTDRDASSIQL